MIIRTVKTKVRPFVLCLEPHKCQRIFFLFYFFNRLVSHAPYWLLYQKPYPAPTLVLIGPCAHTCERRKCYLGYCLLAKCQESLKLPRLVKISTFNFLVIMSLTNSHAWVEE